MINYGVVYPQAILMFTIIMLYSVVQPLIVIFGAAYFGMAYVVYKYKLLFGEVFAIIQLSNPSLLVVNSILQTLRITRSSLAYHICPPHLGRAHLPCFHDGHLLTKEVLHSGDPACAVDSGDYHMVMVHS